MPPHMGSIETLKDTAILTGTVAERRFITLANAQAGLDAVVKGISAMAGVAGDAIPYVALGIVDMIAGAEIAAAGPVVSDANGQPIAKGANVNVAGLALNAAPLGGRVRILIR